MKAVVQENLNMLIGRAGSGAASAASLEAFCKDLFSNTRHIHDNEKVMQPPSGDLEELPTV